MKKNQYKNHILVNDVERIVEQKYKNKCPDCGSNKIYAGCIETQYDEINDENILLSFDVFCKECGNCIGKWDNTNRKYFLCK